MSPIRIPPEYSEPHYSTRLCRGHFRYIAKFYDKSLFETVAGELGVPVDYLLKDDNWVSDSFFTKYITKLKALTGDPDLAEKFGRFTVAPEALNPIEYAVNRAVLFPELFYMAVPSQFSRYNNLNDLVLVRKRIGAFDYEMIPKGNQLSHPDVCKNVSGMLAATGSFFGMQSVKIVHTKCRHEGASACEFTVRFEPLEFWRRRFKLAGGLGFLGIVSFFLDRYLAGTSLVGHHLNGFLFWIAYSLGIAAVFTASKYFGLVKYINQYNDQARERAAEIHRNYIALDRKYNESNLLRELSLKLSETENAHQVIRSCLEDLGRTFGYGRTIIMLLSSDESRLYAAEVRGFGEGTDRIYKMNIQYPTNRESPQLFANILERGETTAVFDIDTYKKILKPENRSLIESFSVSAIVVSPIQDATQKYGLLVVGSVEGERKLTEDDRVLIDSISHLLSLSFQKARNFERESGLRTLFQKYVPAVVLEGMSRLSPRLDRMPVKTLPVTSMFVDLRDFTSRCNRLSPEQIVKMINLYSEFVISRIAAAGGIVDKLAGDGVNAFFPGHESREVPHARNAGLAALYILSDMDELKAQFAEHGFEAPGVGIGLHTGPATIGSMGCNRKLDFTAVGDTINLASRLQDLSKAYRKRTPSALAGVLIASESSFSAAALDVTAEKIMEVPIRGRNGTENVYFVDVESAKNWMNGHESEYSELKRRTADPEQTFLVEEMAVASNN